MPLHKLKPSPFYNMIANNRPVDKILAILHFTQRSFSKQHANTIRMVSSHVRDASAEENTTADTLNSFGTIDERLNRIVRHAKVSGGAPRLPPQSCDTKTKEISCVPSFCLFVMGFMAIKKPNKVRKFFIFKKNLIDIKQVLAR